MGMTDSIDKTDWHGLFLCCTSTWFNDHFIMSNWNTFYNVINSRSFVSLFSKQHLILFSKWELIFVRRELVLIFCLHLKILDFHLVLYRWDTGLLVREGLKLKLFFLFSACTLKYVKEKAFKNVCALKYLTLLLFWLESIMLIYFSKMFDIELCPLPFSLEEMFGFISCRFTGYPASEQEQALLWLHVSLFSYKRTPIWKLSMNAGSVSLVLDCPISACFCCKKKNLFYSNTP